METSVVLLFRGCFVTICIIKWTWTGLLQESHSFWLCKTSFFFWFLKWNWKSSPLSCSPTQNVTACLKWGPEAEWKFFFSFFIPLFLLHRCVSSLFPTLQHAGIPLYSCISLSQDPSDPLSPLKVWLHGEQARAPPDPATSASPCFACSTCKNRGQKQLLSSYLVLQSNLLAWLMAAQNRGLITQIKL